MKSHSRRAALQAFISSGLVFAGGARNAVNASVADIQEKILTVGPFGVGDVLNELIESVKPKRPILLDDMIKSSGVNSGEFISVMNKIKYSVVDNLRQNGGEVQFGNLKPLLTLDGRFVHDFKEKKTWVALSEAKIGEPSIVRNEYLDDGSQARHFTIHFIVALFANSEKVMEVDFQKSLTYQTEGKLVPVGKKEPVER